MDLDHALSFMSFAHEIDSFSFERSRFLCSTKNKYATRVGESKAMLGSYPLGAPVWFHATGRSMCQA